MKKTLTAALFTACAFCVPLLQASPAHAGLAACGNIDVEANAQCEMKVEGGCEVACTPVSFQAACAGELYASCDGSCDLPSVQCDGSCSGTCEGQCTANPGSFDCSANCQARCDGSCSGDCGVKCEGDCSSQCQASGTQASCQAECKTKCSGECQASCKATCSGECDASCKATPPTADCKGKCQASCEGSCKADTNMDCQLKCQAQGHASCQARLEGGCKAACKAPEGALFCNGQYVDHGGNLKECVNSLKAALNIEVKGYAQGSASCSGGSCEAEGEAGCSLSVAPKTDAEAPYYGAALFAVAGAVFGRWRKRRKQ